MTQRAIAPASIASAWFWSVWLVSRAFSRKARAASKRESMTWALRVASLIGLERVAVVIVATDITDFGRGRSERTGLGLDARRQEVDVVRFAAREAGLFAETLFPTAC
jgi:hypothetical protein